MGGKSFLLVSAILNALFLSVLGNDVVMQIFKASRARREALRTKARPDSFREGRVECSDGVVEVNGETYSCNNIDFLSFISAAELEIPGQQLGLSSSDIWGWYDEVNDREITILTLDTGVVFIDSTDPIDPCILSKHHSERAPSTWGDIKVVGDFAYAIKDRNVVDLQRNVGMEVYDLRKLRDRDCKVENYVIPDLPADFIGSDHGACHNVVSNTESKRVYSVGCPNTCDGGLVIFDVAENPLEPKLIGCVDQDGYSHDAQCVIYSGPDEKYFGHEICVAFNEDTFTIWDVTFADDPVLVAREFYHNSGYSHQGWFNYDMTKVMLDDELDELCNANGPSSFECFLAVSGSNGETRTITYVWNVKSLENPFLERNFIHRQESVDHNLYVWGAMHERGWGGNAPLDQIPNPHIAYLNNYMAGLILLDIESENAYDWTEIAHFAITEETIAEFEGMWSGYLHPSGVYAASSIEKGLFFLDPKVEFVAANPIPDFPVIVKEDDGSDDGNGGNGGNGGNDNDDDDDDDNDDRDDRDDDESGVSSGVVAGLSVFLVASLVANAAFFGMMKMKNKSLPQAEETGDIKHQTL